MEENKALDDFIGKSIKEIGLEKPSVKFTDSVLSKIQDDLRKSSEFQHRPLLSKTTWGIILAMVAAIFAYVILGNPNLEDSWFSFVKLNKVTAFYIIERIATFEVPSTFVYAVLVITLFAVVQVYLIKQRFDKRYRFN